MDPRTEAALAESLTGTRQLLPAALGPRVDGVALARYLQMIASPRYGLRAAPGFASGFAAGFLTGARTWRQELEAGLRVVGVGVTVGLTEFFVRRWFEDNPRGLLPHTRQALADLNAIRVLRPVFLWLERTGPEEVMEDLAHLIPTADDLVAIIGRAAIDWVNGLLRTAPDAAASGTYLGTLTGRAVIELIRAVCEPEALMALTAAGAIEAGGTTDARDTPSAPDQP